MDVIIVTGYTAELLTIDHYFLSFFQNIKNNPILYMYMEYIISYLKLPTDHL